MKLRKAPFAGLVTFLFACGIMTFIAGKDPTMFVIAFSVAWAFYLTIEEEK